jgi:hypothetical protein
MSIATPLLQVGAVIVALENPSSWSVEQIMGDTELTTLSGKTLTQVSYRKYKFILEWEAIFTDKYNTLEGQVNSAIDQGLSCLFTWVKWPQSSSGVTVKARLSVREKVAGAGTTYYSGVKLVLTQISRVGPPQAYPYLPT